MLNVIISLAILFATVGIVSQWINFIARRAQRRRHSRTDPKHALRRQLMVNIRERLKHQGRG